MLFKLLMPYINKGTEGVIFIQWYKDEGDKIDYGDDIFEVKIEEEKSNLVLETPARVLASLAEPENTSEKIHKLDMLVRVCSADIGFLRRTYAQEFVYQKVGALLAVLTTDVDEEINEFNLEAASTLRVVPNLISYPGIYV
ncbi:hypothetical protein [Nostoc sp. 'Peltigera membranacea cyanobiont' N6]|uniref:hypothetical protein n=1 Tax=Nostoc sp. 'Peltigera membranacea cyanobiont' N6 TaxID=1261031 RepID=UPI000CF30389|nr:hypothetical protein [Nostoc sp. 'Peltigera membranacea cyanobiont' N6]AVH63799.1 hypothetical protein NPM_2042 [Nostoc sp. 'Peltigera membranacea cyanobiont' N6]